MSLRTDIHRVRKDTRALNPYGSSVWHVWSAVSASGSGVSWDAAFKTFAEALAVASAGDVIKVRGEFNESGLELAVELTIIGQDVSNNHYRTLFYSDAETPIFIVKANNVTIKNLGIAQMAAYPAIQLGDAASQSWYKLLIQNCKFDGWGTSTGAIAYGDATVDTPDIHIENCLFRSFDGDILPLNSTRARVNNCIMLLVATYAAISHIPTTSNRPDSIYANNRIIGVNSTDTGIEIVNTPDAGKLIAYGNYIFNCATSITQKATNVAVQMNYTNDGAGGALIDPIA